MGTRYDDQPPEHWAGPGSLDPTPVWKQFLLIGLLLIAGLGAVLVFAYLALAVHLATPPSLVPGGRLVLAKSDIPAIGAPAKRFGAPLVSEREAFFLTQPTRGEVIALRARWAPADGAALCEVEARATAFVSRCGTDLAFGPAGEPTAAPRSLDRYLVSIEGERVVVNLSRLINGYGATPQPTLVPYR